MVVPLDTQHGIWGIADNPEGSTAGSLGVRTMGSTVEDWKRRQVVVHCDHIAAVAEGYSRDPQIMHLLGQTNKIYCRRVKI